MGQKRFWLQLAIFGALVIGWIIIFIANGTIFYWQDNAMKMIFYWLAAAAFATLVIMNIIASLVQSLRKELTDERDKAISRKASLWATGASYTVVVALLLALAITYMEGGRESIPVAFPLFIVLIGGATLVLTQAIAALVMYGRKVSHADG
jgi:hypothetical protein